MPPREAALRDKQLENLHAVGCGPLRSWSPTIHIMSANRRSISPANVRRARRRCFHMSASRSAIVEYDPRRGRQRIAGSSRLVGRSVSKKTASLCARRTGTRTTLRQRADRDD